MLRMVEYSEGLLFCQRRYELLNAVVKSYETGIEIVLNGGIL